MAGQSECFGIGNSVDLVKVDSNLASIINILSQEDLTGIIDSPEINSFEIVRRKDRQTGMPQQRAWNLRSWIREKSRACR